MEEIFNLVRQEIARAGFEDRISAGIVIAGGCATLEGMPELAEQVFNLPVRRGMPREVGGLTDVVRNAMYAGGVGLVQLAAKSGASRDKVKGEAETGYSKVRSRVREWLSEIF